MKSKLNANHKKGLIILFLFSQCYANLIVAKAFLEANVESIRDVTGLEKLAKKALESITNKKCSEKPMLQSVIIIDD